MANKNRGSIVNSWVENARKWGGGTHVCGDFWPEVKVEGQ